MTEDEQDFSALFNEPIRSLAVQRDGNAKPRTKDLKRYPDRVRVANLYCTRKARTLVGVVLHGNLVPTTEGVLERLGADFWADCRCDISHAIDGDLLLRAVLDLPERRLRANARPPGIDVRHVERRRQADGTSVVYDGH